MVTATALTLVYYNHDFIQDIHSTAEAVYLNYVRHCGQSPLSQFLLKIKIQKNTGRTMCYVRCEKNSTLEHNPWIDTSKSDNGIILNQKHNAKYAYKVAIRRKKLQTESKISDNLDSLLVDNDQQSCWKLW